MLKISERMDKIFSIITCAFSTTVFGVPLVQTLSERSIQTMSISEIIGILFLLGASLGSAILGLYVLFNKGDNRK